jgi:hypothetical protein
MCDSFEDVKLLVICVYWQEQSKAYYRLALSDILDSTTGR